VKLLLGDGLSSSSNLKGIYAKRGARQEFVSFRLALASPPSLHYILLPPSLNPSPAVALTQLRLLRSRASVRGA
jgi:hypothetical protein